jgi:hypothetical protein
MKLRVEFSLKRNELCVWDGDVLVAMYDVVSYSLPSLEANVCAKVKSKPGFLNGRQLHAASTEFLMSNRTVVLDNNVTLSSEPLTEGGYVQLLPADVNELALLLSIGSEAVIKVVEEGVAEAQL